MILRRLRLKNYRNYRSLEIEFPTGLIGVVGRNGVGKTTLLEAIAFALYGSEASRTKAKGLRRDGAGNEETCEVELEFSLGGEPYRIIRWLKGANEAQQAVMYHRSNSEPMATQPSGVQATVRKLVGMDYATFSRSVFSKQKEVNALSDARPEERRADPGPLHRRLPVLHHARRHAPPRRRPHRLRPGGLRAGRGGQDRPGRQDAQGGNPLDMIK